MKNKMTAVIGLLIFTLSCSKTEIQPRDVSSGQATDGRIRQGEMTVIWQNPKGTYPNLRTTIYDKYRITPYETYDGTKYTSFRKDPKKALRRDTLRVMRFGDKFQVGYGNQLDTVVAWKTLSGYTAVIKKSGIETESFSARRTDGSSGDVSVSTVRKVTLTESDSVRSKTGYGTGADTINGKFSSWDYLILKKLVFVGDYKYPLSGIEQFIIDGTTTKEIDYGTGTKDNIAYLTVNGGNKEKITLPYAGTPVLIGDDD